MNSVEGYGEGYVSLIVKYSYYYSIFPSCREDDLVGIVASVYLCKWEEFWMYYRLYAYRRTYFDVVTVIECLSGLR